MAAPNTPRRGIITARDTELLRALAFCPLLTTEQVKRLSLPAPEKQGLEGLRKKRGFFVPENGFANTNTARRRLYLLKKRGLLTTHKPSGHHPVMWRLTPEGHDTIVNRLLALEHYHDLELPYTDYEPDPVRAEHYHAIAEVFVQVQPLLTHLYGPLPYWDWRDERRAYSAWTVGGRLGEEIRYQPDAEIEIGGYLMILERQTERPHKSATEIRKKVETHAKYLRYDRHWNTDIAESLFACDLDRDARAAAGVAEELGIEVFAAAPAEAIHHVHYVAHRMHEALGVSPAAPYGGGRYFGSSTPPVRAAAKLEEEFPEFFADEDDNPL